MTRPIAAPNMHWTRLLLSLIFVSVVRSAVWSPIPINFAALNMPTMGAWTDRISPNIELTMFGDSGTDLLLGFLTLRTTDPATIDSDFPYFPSSALNQIYPNKVSDHTATIYGSPQSLFGFGGVDVNGNYLSTTFRTNRTSIGQPNPVTLVARAGHSAVTIPQGTLGCTSSKGECVLIFGGRNLNTYFNEMQRVDPETFTTVSVPQTNQPAARYHHTAVVVSGKMYVMGGQDSAGNVLNELLVFDFSTSTWSSGATMPVTLTGHAAVAMGSDIFVFGGRVSPSLLSNTLYKYDTVNNAWSTTPETENTPTPRVYPRVVAIDANRFVIYGGNNGTTVLNDFVVYDMSKPCAFFCPFSKKCESEAACSNYIGCYNRTSDSALFKCRLTCVTDPRTCTPETCTKFTCWNGLCAETADDCDPYPRCPLTWRRCADGLCSANCVAFNATQCSGVWCADGSCVSDESECIPFNGCEPGLIQCPSGECASVLEDCYCNGTTQFSCVLNTANYSEMCASSCDTPWWMKTAIRADLTVPISKKETGNVGSAVVYREGRNEILAAVIFNVTTQATSAAVSIAPVPESRFSRAKYALWTSDEDYRRKVLSAVIEVSSDQPASQVVVAFAFNLFDGLAKPDRCLARLVESTVNGSTTATWKCVQTNFPQIGTTNDETLTGALLEEYGVFAVIAIKVDSTPSDTQLPYYAPSNYEPEAHMGIAITAGGLLFVLVLIVVIRAIQQRS